jgi:hypothetical protein
MRGYQFGASMDLGRPVSDPPRSALLARFLFFCYFKPVKFLQSPSLK